MEFDHNLLFNFASIVAAFLLSAATCITIFQKLKTRWPVTVNCWFCNNDTKVWRQERNWWLCPSCEQYNGFSRDGDYNYDIPEQYKASLNNPAKLYSKSFNAEESPAKNGLCSNCNRNEELKMQDLANFEPLSPRRFDQELEEFKQRLDEKYQLCGKCENIVKGVLRKQASWLLQYKMIFFRNKPIQAIVNNGEKWERVFRIFLTILDAATIYYAGFLPLTIAGLFLQLGACLASPANRRTSDIIAAFFWIFLSVIAPFKELRLLKINLRYDWFVLEHLTQYHVVVILASTIGLMNIKSSSYNMNASMNASFKKLKSPSRNRMSMMPPVPNARNISPTIREETTSRNGNIKNCQSPVNITNLLMTPVSVETPMPIKPMIFSQSPMMFQNQHSFSPSHSHHGFTNQNMGFHNSNSFARRQPEVDKYSLAESLSTLSSLSLGENCAKQFKKTPKVFQTKVYGTSGPDLFSKLNKSPNRKFVLSPPKLKSVTQSSWVAGGYWQAGMDIPSLSRSSSQSSGFGSIGSNFVPSREPSVYNDFDRCSVTSDMTQCCHMSRQNSVTSINSCCHPVSAFSFARPESPAFSQSPKNGMNSTFMRNNTSPFQGFQANKTFQTNQSVQNQTAIANNMNPSQEAPMQTVQTTVLTSPVWLPALLCGSLVFNMLVLCTTLLR